MAELPVAKNLFLCETVVVEERTQNVSLINCFSRWFVDAFPSSPQRFAICVVLSNGNGRIPLRVEIASLSHEEILYARSAVVDFTSRYRKCD